MNLFNNIIFITSFLSEFEELLIWISKHTLTIKKSLAIGTLITQPIYLHYSLTKLRYQRSINERRQQMETSFGKTRPIKQCKFRRGNFVSRGYAGIFVVSLT